MTPDRNPAKGVTRHYPRWLIPASGLALAVAQLSGLAWIAGRCIGDRIERVAAQNGMTVSIRDISIDPGGRIDVVGIEVAGPEGSEASARVDLASVEVELGDVLEGSAPSINVEAKGVLVTIDRCPRDAVAIGREMESRAGRLFPGGVPAPGRGGARAGLPASFRVAVEDATIRCLDITGSVIVLLDGMEIAVSRSGEDEAILVTAKGRAPLLAGTSFKADAEEGASGGRAGSVSFDPPLAVNGRATVGGLHHDTERGLVVLDVAVTGIERGPVRAGIRIDEVAVRTRENRIPRALEDVVRLTLGGVYADLRTGMGLADLEGLVKGRNGGSGGASTAEGGPSRRLPVLPFQVEVASGWLRVFERGAENPWLTIESLRGVAVVKERTWDIAGVGHVTIEGQLGFDLSARLEGTEDPLAPDRIELAASHLPLPAIVKSRHEWEWLGPGGDVDVDVTWSRPPPGSTMQSVSGRLVLRGVEVQHRRLSKDPVVIDGVSLGFEASRDRRARTWKLRAKATAASGAHAVLELSASGSASGPVYDLALDIPEQPCGALARAVPAGLLPTIGDGLRLEGDLRGRVEVRHIDPRDFYRLTLTVGGDIDRCRIVSLGERQDTRLALLQTDFSLEVDEGEGPIGVFVGPGTQGYVPISRLHDLLQLGPMLSEDGEFLVHKGIHWSHVQDALRLDLTRGGYVYGGSSITQQLVKNLFVGRTKTAARKLEEAIVVTAVERTLGKQRILELYLNCIEYGVKVYGIGRAARHYFGKEVRDLAPVEIAFLMHLKPWPKQAYYAAKKGVLPDAWRQGIKKRMTDMLRYGYISQEQYDSAAPFDPFVGR